MHHDDLDEGFGTIFERGLDYDGPGGVPETVTLSLDDDPIEEHPGEPYWVIDRKNPVTLSAAVKTDVVTTLNKILDQLHDLRTDVENTLMYIDIGG